MRRSDITEEQALERLSDAREIITVSNWNADLLIECRDGSILAFWAESDYGPAYWMLGEPVSAA